MPTMPSAFTGAGSIGSVPVAVTGTPVAGSGLMATTASAATWGAAPVTLKPANPASTVSTTLVMMGVGGTVTYTPKATGLVAVTVTGTATTATAAVNLTLGGRFGTGSAPGNGVAVISPTPPGIGIGVPFALTDLVTLTLVATWFDIALLTSAAADAASVANLSFTITELG